MQSVTRVFCACTALIAACCVRVAFAESLAFEPKSIDFGTIVSSSDVSPPHQDIYIRNDSDDTSTIVQLSVGCGCLQLNTPLPAEIPAHGRWKAEISVVPIKAHDGKASYKLQASTTAGIVAEAVATYDFEPFIRLDRTEISKVSTIGQANESAEVVNVTVPSGFCTQELRAEVPPNWELKRLPGDDPPNTAMYKVTSLDPGRPVQSSDTLHFIYPKVADARSDLLLSSRWIPPCVADPPCLLINGVTNRQITLKSSVELQVLSITSTSPQIVVTCPPTTLPAAIHDRANGDYIRQLQVSINGKSGDIVDQKVTVNVHCSCGDFPIEFSVLGVIEK